MAWVQAWVREWVKARVKAWVKAGMGPGSYLFHFNSILNHTYHGPRDRGAGGGGGGRPPPTHTHFFAKYKMRLYIFSFIFSAFFFLQVSVVFYHLFYHCVGGTLCNHVKNINIFCDGEYKGTHALITEIEFELERNQSMIHLIKKRDMF